MLKIGVILGVSFLVLGFNSEVEMCMMLNLNSLRKLVGTATKTVVTAIGGYTGMKVQNYSTSSRSTIYYGISYEPKNYSKETLAMLNNLEKAYINKNVGEIYKIWRIFLCNPNDFFSQSNGKLCNLVNAMTEQYNKINGFSLREKDFFTFFELSVDAKIMGVTFSDQFNNSIETIQMEIAARKSQYRNLDNPQLEGFANLGGQTNNDCKILIRYNTETKGIDFCYIDCKKTDAISFRLKLEEMQKLGFQFGNVKNAKEIFGCNLYLIAQNDKNVILSIEEKAMMLGVLNQLAEENPSFFKDFEKSKEFLEFKKSGNMSVLSSSIYPFPKVQTSLDVQKFFRYNPVKEENYVSNLVKQAEKELGISTPET